MAKRRVAARLQDIVDQKNIAAMHIAVDILDDLDALRHRTRSIAGQRDELDFRRKADRVHRPDEVGGEDEGAFENGNDQKIIERPLDDLLGHFNVARRNHLGGIERINIFFHGRRAWA